MKPTSALLLILIVGHASLVMAGEGALAVMWSKDHASAIEPSSLRAPSQERRKIEITAGSFMMGQSEGHADESPTHHAFLDTFWLDARQVTVGEYRRCVTKGSCPASINEPKNDRLAAEDVSWFQAEAYCRSVGGRLPTEAEWEKAAQRDHDDGSISPSKLGEWVSDWYDSAYYRRSSSLNPQGPTRGIYKVIRGGCADASSGRTSNTCRRRALPVARRYRVAFRCAFSRP
jgi:formylglycine-generating enzyme required for sulfatase activity